MKVKISTLVDQDYLLVKDKFNAYLLKSLSPPFPKVTIRKFDGIHKGDLVSMELDFFLFKQLWNGEIVADEHTDKEFFFIDVGTKLPFFLKNWQHKHRLLNKGTQTLIIDEVEYISKNKVFTLLLYPVMILQFLYRKPIYKRFFSKKNVDNLAKA